MPCLQAIASLQAVSTDGLVLPKGVAGAWDEAAVGAPIVSGARARTRLDFCDVKVHLGMGG